MRRQLPILAMLLALACTIQVGWLWPAVSTTLTFCFAFVVIAITTFVLRWSTALWYSLAQGLLIDLFSPFIFGTYTITCLVLVISIGLLQDTWLKQHSLLSVATIAATSLLIAQILLLSLVALTEYSDIIITQTAASVTILAFIFGLLAMIGLTTIGVRLFNRQYVKLI